MNTVFVVLIGWNYEGSVIMSIHTERAKADEHFRELAKLHVGDFQEIEEWPIGAKRKEAFDSVPKQDGSDCGVDYVFKMSGIAALK